MLSCWIYNSIFLSLCFPLFDLFYFHGSRISCSLIQPSEAKSPNKMTTQVFISPFLNVDLDLGYWGEPIDFKFFFFLCVPQRVQEFWGKYHILKLAYLALNSELQLLKGCSIMPSNLCIHCHTCLYWQWSTNTHGAKLMAFPTIKYIEFIRQEQTHFHNKFWNLCRDTPLFLFPLIPIIERFPLSPIPYNSAPYSTRSVSSLMSIPFLVKILYRSPISLVTNSFSNVPFKK